MDLSLIICTKNRAAQLSQTLAYVGQLRSNADWEVIIVDSGSTDDTPRVITDFLKSATFPATTTYEAQPGNGRGRNAGLALARGTIIAFSDDDCYLTPDYVDQVLEVFKASEIGFAGGRIKLYDPSDYPITIRDLDSPQYFAPRSFIPGGTIQGANMMFRRQVLDAIDGFDNAFGAGGLFSGDDVEACARASFAGWWGMYSPGPTVAHHHGRKEKHVNALKRRYAIGRGAYLMKFSLNRDSAAVYRRVWLQRLRRFWTLGPRNCAQELYGSLSYLFYRLAQSRDEGRSGLRAAPRVGVIRDEADHVIL
jgi:glycosyltransferase involved in cell wall biosynthesis